MLGVPGLFDLYRAGRVTIVNAPGGGIADDKAIYSYIPEIIEFYTGRAPILQNVPTYNCRRPDDLKYVLEHLSELVVKEVHGSGGYGMLVGPTRVEGRDRSLPPQARGQRQQLTSPSRRWRCRPARRWSRRGVAPRHLDLRPFVLVRRRGPPHRPAD